MKNPVGRPKKYTDEVLDKLAVSLNKWVEKCYKDDEFRLLAEWCMDNGFSVYNFKKYIPHHEGFRQAYLAAKAYQEYQVTKGALTKKYDSRFCMFFLGCQHGWKAKDDSEQQKRDLRNDFSKFLDHIKGEVSEEESDADFD